MQGKAGQGKTGRQSERLAEGPELMGTRLRGRDEDLG